MQDEKILYDWSEFDIRVRQRGYKNAVAWCESHGFAYKTLNGLIHNRWPCNYGPKAKAIIDQALREDLILKEELDDAV